MVVGACGPTGAESWPRILHGAQVYYVGVRDANTATRVTECSEKSVFSSPADVNAIIPV